MKKAPQHLITIGFTLTLAAMATGLSLLVFTTPTFMNLTAGCGLSAAFVIGSCLIAAGRALERKNGVIV